MKRAVLILMLLLLVIAPLSASAFSLVNCGTIKNADGTIQNPCQLEHLVKLIMRLINYLITVAAVVAIHRVLSVGFGMVVAVGNPEKIKKMREGLEQAVIGFAIVVLAFVFLNLLMNGLFGLGSTTASRSWWDPKCIYLDSAGCPQGVFTPRDNSHPLTP